LKDSFSKWSVPDDSIFPFTIFCDLEDITFEISNISENNISNGELAKVLAHFFFRSYFKNSKP
jgi:hypothetical protein